MCAFGCAFALHFLAWSFFHVASFFPTQDPPLLPFVPAIADVPSHATFAELSHRPFDEVEALLAFPFPQIEEVPFPKIAKENPLLALFEKKAIPLPDLDPPPLEAKLQIAYFPVSLKVSGGLPAPFPLDIQQQVGTLPQQFLFLFHVEIDGESGNIMWFQKIKGPKEKKLIKEAENHLLSLKFPPSQKAYLSGNIEITLRK